MNTNETTNTNTNTNTNTTLTAEQLEALGLTQELYDSLPPAAKAAILKGLKPAKKERQVDLWSNRAL